MKYLKNLIAIVIAILTTAAYAKDPLKVYILVGQSNMQGHAAEQTVPGIAADPTSKALHDKIVDEKGKYRVLNDVHIAAITGTLEKPVTKSGPLTMGYGGNLGGSPGAKGKHAVKFGPELTFGATIREHVEGPSLIIKAAWGGKSLHGDFLSPSGAELLKGKETGPYYKAMCAHVKSVLTDPGKYCPAYDKTAGYEIAGFVWFQGWNDQEAKNEQLYTSTNPPFKVYGDLLACFIRDVRKEFNAPEMPFVIGVIGTGGKPDAKHPFREAMAAPASMPEFKGNVVAVHTAKYFDNKLSELMDRSWRWQSPAWDPEKKYVELAKKLKPLNDKLKESQKISDQRERGRKYWAIKKEIAEATYTPEELKYLEINKSNAGFHYFGSGKMIGWFGEAFAKALVEIKR